MIATRVGGRLLTRPARIIVPQAGAAVATKTFIVSSGSTADIAIDLSGLWSDAASHGDINGYELELLPLSAIGEYSGTPAKAARGWGASDGTHHAAFSVMSQDDVASAVNGMMGTASHVLLELDDAGATGKLQHKSVGTDTITLGCNDAFSNTLVVRITAYAGYANWAVINYTRAATTGTGKQVQGSGGSWTPNFVKVLRMGVTTLDSYTTNPDYSIGMASGASAQHCIAGTQRSAQTSNYTWEAYRGGDLTAFVTGSSGSAATRDQFEGFTNSPGGGFTYNQVNNTTLVKCFAIVMSAPAVAVVTTAAQPTVSDWPTLVNGVHPFAALALFQPSATATQSSATEGQIYSTGTLTAGSQTCGFFNDPNRETLAGGQLSDLTATLATDHFLLNRARTGANTWGTTGAIERASDPFADNRLSLHQSVGDSGAGVIILAVFGTACTPITVNGDLISLAPGTLSWIWDGTTPNISTNDFCPMAEATLFSGYKTAGWTNAKTAILDKAEELGLSGIGIINMPVWMDKPASDSTAMWSQYLAGTIAWDDSTNGCYFSHRGDCTYTADGSTMDFRALDALMTEIVIPLYDRFEAKGKQFIIKMGGGGTAPELVDDTIGDASRLAVFFRICCVHIRDTFAAKYVPKWINAFNEADGLNHPDPATWKFSPATVRNLLTNLRAELDAAGLTGTQIMVASTNRVDTMAYAPITANTGNYIGMIEALTGGVADLAASCGAFSAHLYNGVSPDPLPKNAIRDAADARGKGVSMTEYSSVGQATGPQSVENSTHEVFLDSCNQLAPRTAGLKFSWTQFGWANGISGAAEEGGNMMFLDCTDVVNYILHASKSGKFFREHWQNLDPGAQRIGALVPAGSPLTPLACINPDGTYKFSSRATATRTFTLWPVPNGIYDAYETIGDGHGTVTSEHAALGPITVTDGSLTLTISGAGAISAKQR